MNDKVMCEDGTDDFLSQFPFTSFFHDDSVFGKHFERRGVDIGLNIIVLIVVLVKFLDKIWVHYLN